MKVGFFLRSKRERSFMKNDTQIWLSYAEDNLNSAKILYDNGLFNPCLQNVQQTVEKALKAMLTELEIPLIKTHNIAALRQILLINSIDVDLSIDECEFLDSIYLPSKYPVGSILPFFEPDKEICISGIEISERVFMKVSKMLPNG